MSKKISFFEYQPLWVEYTVEVNISDEDYQQLENDEINLNDVINKYEVEYGEVVITDNFVGSEYIEYEGFKLIGEDNE